MNQSEPSTKALIEYTVNTVNGYCQFISDFFELDLEQVIEEFKHMNMLVGIYTLWLQEPDKYYKMYGQTIPNPFIIRFNRIDKPEHISDDDERRILIMLKYLSLSVRKDMIKFYKNCTIGSLLAPTVLSTISVGDSMIMFNSRKYERKIDKVFASYTRDTERVTVVPD